MGIGTNFYQITLPPGTRSEEFERFALEQVFPAVGTGSNRVGAVTGLRLLKDVQDSGEYVLAIGWNGLRLPEAFVATPLEKLSDFGAAIRPLGAL
jgi:hypothetical protein